MHRLRLPGGGHHPALTVAIVLGLVFGVLTRAMLLRLDATPFPSRPHGRINYLFLGFVASVLGSLAPAALLTANYTAGVFLAIGLSQFHSVRQIERDLLLALDRAALVPRGRAYIEGLAMMVETRNYLVMLTAMATTATTLLLGPLVGGAAGLLVGLAVTALAQTGTSVGSVAWVEAAEVASAGQVVSVGGIEVWREAPDAAMAALGRAIGVRVRPRDLAARLLLAEPGQRQAILHNVASNMGIRRAAAPGGTVALLPHSALNPHGGDLALLLFPTVRSAAVALRVVRRTPLLETLEHRMLRGHRAEEGD